MALCTYNIILFQSISVSPYFPTILLLFQWNEHAEMDRLACTQMTIIDCQYYAIDSLP